MDFIGSKRLVWVELDAFGEPGGSLTSPPRAQDVICRGWGGRSDPSGRTAPKADHTA